MTDRDRLEPDRIEPGQPVPGEDHRNAEPGVMGGPDPATSGSAPDILGGPDRSEHEDVLASAQPEDDRA